MIDRAEEHLGPERAARYLRKFYPWYLERLGADKEIADALQQSEDARRGTSPRSGLALPPAAVRRLAVHTFCPAEWRPDMLARSTEEPGEGKGIPMIKKRCSRLV